MLRLDINLVFTIVNIVVLYICMRLFLFKPVNKILKQRQDAVQKQFDDAKEAQDKAEALKQEYEASLTNARAESDRMMEEAKKKADAEYERVLKNADEEAAAKMQQAEEAIKVEKEKSMRKMQDEIKDLVVSVASKVVGDQVSAEDSSRLYDDLLQKWVKRNDTDME